MYGGCQQRSTLNVISYQPSTLSTITQTLLMGAGIYAQYRGQHEVDKMTAKLTEKSMDAITAAGGIPLFRGGGAGGYFGQNGGIYGMNGGMMGGGMCGAPPYNTAHTGCMGGGQIGMPVGGGCPGGMCGGGAGGGMPCGGGVPCGAGGGCGGGGCGGGMQGNCGGWGCGGSAGCQPGMPCQGYMNDPILGARPGGLNGGYSPFDLDFEKQRTQQMLDDARRRNQALSDLARRQQELNDIRRQADEANRKYNSAYDGYNGILANIYGPGGGNGNPGMYQGPGGGRGCGERLQG
jgi:hypothetical protein